MSESAPTYRAVFNGVVVFEQNAEKVSGGQFGEDGRIGFIHDKAWAGACAAYERAANEKQPMGN